RITAFPYGDTVKLINFYYISISTGDVCGFHNNNPRLNVDEYYIHRNSVVAEDADGNDCYANYHVIASSGPRLMVTPANLKITLADITGVTYGDEWAYPDEQTKIEGLEYNEELSFALAYTDADGNAVEAPKNAGTYAINPDESTYAIKNEDGSKGLITNYEITFESGTLTIDKREIHAKFEKGLYYIEYGEDLPEFKYTFHERDVYDVEYALPYGEVMTFTFNYYNADTEEYVDTPKDAGYVYKLEIYSVFVDGVLQTNATSNYKLYIAPPWMPSLFIERKVVTPVLDDFSQVYGDEISYDFGIVDQFSPEGYEYLGHGESVLLKIRYLQNGEEVTPVYVGVYEIEVVKYYVYDKDGNLIENGENNYSFRPELGKMTITARPVTITVRDRELTYGETLTFWNPLFEDVEGVEHDENGNYIFPYGDKFAVGFLIDGEPSSATKIYNAGTHPISVSKWGIYNAGNVVPNENYDITWVDGTLTVKPRTVYLVIDSVTKAEYGATPEKNGFKICLSADGEGGEYELPDKAVLTADYGYYLFGDPDKQFISVKNTGEYGVTAVKAYLNGVETGIGEAAYTDGNYIIEVVDGKLTVTPKKLTVVLNPFETLVYGETFTYAAGVGNYANADVLELAYGEKLEVAVEYLIDGEVGTPKNVNYDERRDRYYFAYSARLNAKACTVYDENGDEIENGSNNYIIECEDLEDLQIVRRTVFIYLLDYSEQYGDFAGYSNEIGNYKRVEYSDGEIRVEGVPYNEQFKIKVEYLDENKVVVEEPKNVGTYKIRFTNAEVYDSNGDLIEFGTNNYSFATAAPYQGTLEIVPREVKIVLSSYEKEYGEFKIGEYGTFAYPETVNNYNAADSGALAFGEQIKVDIKYQLNGTDVTPKNVGVYDIVGVDYTVFDGENEVSKDNYRIRYEAGTLEIIQKALTVSISKNMKSVYGGALPEVDHYIADARGAQLVTLPYGDRFEAEFAYYQATDPETFISAPRNAGTYGITVKAASVNGDAVQLENSEGNYYITVEDGELTISQAEIFIALNSLDDVYYGKIPVYATGVNNYDTENSTRLADGDGLEVAVTFINYSALDYAGANWTCGEYVIELDEENCLIHFNGETMPLVVNYKVVGFEAGYVTVSPRKVEVTFESREYVYGSGTVGNEKFTVKVDISDAPDGTLSATELPYGEILSFENAYYKNGVQVNAHNAGVYGIRAGIAYIDGRVDGAGNYSFNFNTDATLTITKKTVEITLDDMNRQYWDFWTLGEDGNFAVKLPETGTVKQTEGSEKEILANGETLIVYIKFTEVGKESTADFIEPKNVGKYSIVATTFTVISYESGVYDDGQESGAGNELTN
ncbi:MAG: hypothetical protein K2J54_05685, partial [Clostridia bacterium]|nr:hypothetical protein [Clostridia bacterium]